MKPIKPYFEEIKLKICNYFESIEYSTYQGELIELTQEFILDLLANQILISDYEKYIEDYFHKYRNNDD